MFDAALFVRSASPGAVLRFLERRKDPEKPAELLLSEAVGEEKWRALLAPLNYLENVAEPLSVAFQRAAIFSYCDLRLMLNIYEEGTCMIRYDAEIVRKKWIPSIFKASISDIKLLALVNKIGSDFGYAGLPIGYMTKPPKNVMDYDTVGILDQRNLLVEDSPRLYRFSL